MVAVGGVCYEEGGLAEPMVDHTAHHTGVGHGDELETRTAGRAAAAPCHHRTPGLFDLRGV